MYYHSTRGLAPHLTFSAAMLSGLARDGGLYVPHAIPTLSHATIAGFAGQSYNAVTEAVLTPYLVGDSFRSKLPALIAKAYQTFRHSAMVPLVELERNLFLAELFHGPTLAFKDLAMQLLGQMMNALLEERGQRATILGATSGDTGAAAVSAFANLPAIDLFILYPNGRISEVQRRQMTTSGAGNVHCLAVDGTFDDCQALVKTLFNDMAFRDETHLSGINSINWARVAAQMVYFFTTSVSLGAPYRPVSFSVPTGNFGNILAGYYAKKMGLSIETLMIASNSNDILPRVLESGQYKPQGVVPTQSPSMDIQISSNFERLLFDVFGQDGTKLRGTMNNFAQSGELVLETDALATIHQNFAACRVSEDDTTTTMREVYQGSGYVLDPHSAIGVYAARRQLAKNPQTPVIALATAHPAKFPDAVKAATGVCPALPTFMGDLYERLENTTPMSNNAQKLANFIKTHRHP